MNHNKLLFTVIHANRDKFDQCVDDRRNLGWFVGQIMKLSDGQADVALVTQNLELLLDIAECVNESESED